MTHLSKTVAAALCAAAFSFGAPQASAEMVNLTNQGGALGGETKMTVMRTPGVFSDMYVGGFNVHINSADSNTPLSAGQNILAWCLEVARPFATGVTANYNVFDEPDSLANGWADSVKRLFTKFGSDVVDRVTSAAMQLAIWEIVSGDTDYNLSTGDFQAKAIAGKTNSEAAFAKAQTWLDWLNLNPNAGNNGYRVVYLQYDSGNKHELQDLVTMVPTPLPGAALMFLSALGVGGLARRKKTAKAVAA